MELPVVADMLATSTAGGTVQTTTKINSCHWITTRRAGTLRHTTIDRPHLYKVFAFALEGKVYIL